MLDADEIIFVIVVSDCFSGLLRWKPLGGRFYINYDGHVITLIDPKQRIPSHLEQFADLTDDQKQLVEIKEASTKMFAIYLGKWELDEMFKFIRPRRYGEPIPTGRKNELLNILGGEISIDKSRNVSMVPDDAEEELPFPEIPSDTDIAVVTITQSEEE